MSFLTRLLAAKALLFSFAIWNMGFPAVLKGFLDKVFLPGVSFTLDEDGAYNPGLHNIKCLLVSRTI
jgi:putative NADPH-quinone reductase